MFNQKQKELDQLIANKDELIKTLDYNLFLANEIKSSNILSENFVYNSYNKILYLLLVIFLAAATYFIICYLLGILKIKNYKTN